MSGAYELNALRVSPPESVFQRQTVTSSEGFKLPKSWEKSWLTIAAQTEDAWVIVRGATAEPTVVAGSGARGTIDGSDEITVDENAGDHILAGTEKHFDLSLIRLGQNERIWVAHISAGTTGEVRFKKSSGGVPA